jgi:hypothetical protein
MIDERGDLRHKSKALLPCAPEATNCLPRRQFAAGRWAIQLGDFAGQFNTIVSKRDGLKGDRLIIKLAEAFDLTAKGVLP